MRCSIGNNLIKCIQNQQNTGWEKAGLVCGHILVSFCCCWFGFFSSLPKIKFSPKNPKISAQALATTYSVCTGLEEMSFSSSKVIPALNEQLEFF